MRSGEASFPPILLSMNSIRYSKVFVSFAYYHVDQTSVTFCVSGHKTSRSENDLQRNSLRSFCTINAFFSALYRNSCVSYNEEM